MSDVWIGVIKVICLPAIIVLAVGLMIVLTAAALYLLGFISGLLVELFG